MSELCEKTEKLTSEVDAKDLKLQSMTGFIGMLREKVAKLREVAKKDKANVAVQSVFMMSFRRSRKM